MFGKREAKETNADNVLEKQFSVKIFFKSGGGVSCGVDDFEQGKKIVGAIHDTFTAKDGEHCYHLPEEGVVISKSDFSHAYVHSQTVTKPKAAL